MMIGMGGVKANMPEFQRRVGVLIDDYKKKAAHDAAQATPAPATITVPGQAPTK